MSSTSNDPSALGRREAFAAMLDYINDGVVLVETSGRVLASNSVYGQMSGYTLEELASMHLWDIEAGHTPQQILENLGAMTAGGGKRFESVHRRKDGSLFDAEVSLKRLPDSEHMVFGVVRDITERKRAAADMQRALDLQEQLARIAATVPGAIYTFCLHPDGRTTLPYASPNVWDLFGTTEEIASTDFNQAIGNVHPDDRDGLLSSIFESAETLQPWRKDFRIVHPDGRAVWVEGHSVPRREPDGTTVWVGYVHDVSERRRAEAALRLSESRLRTMADTIGEVFWLASLALDEVYFVSAAFERVWGWPVDALYQNPRLWVEAIEPAYRAAALEAMDKARRGAPATAEYRIRRPDGQLRWVVDRAYPVHDDEGALTGVCGVAVDVTEQRDLEARLRHSQKMDALGLLAGGIAHDFNNLMMLVAGYCDCLMEDGVAPPFVEYVHEIQTAARRATDLTRQLLAFSRRQTSTPTTLDLDEVVASTLSMLARIVGEDVTVRHIRGARPVRVHADRTLLDQVLLNLAVNARDAMPRGGTLDIEVSTVDGPAGALRPGRWACLRVADTGCGMAPELLPRIFEPFFTTKPTGTGTGLGLATVYGIVEQHQGWIDVVSEVAKGTEFRVHLPLHDVEATAPTPAPPHELRHRGHERILLVEDEAPVRQLLRRMLTRLGYEVVEAADGPQALAIWEAEAGRFDLVVTDVIMPNGMNGLELGRRLHEERPSLPVLYLSGYSPELAGTVQEGVEYLSKPCSPPVLGKAVRRLLDSGG